MELACMKDKDLHTKDMKTHFIIKIQRHDTKIQERVIIDLKCMVEDLFDPLISADILGSRDFLIVYMQANARSMNVETGLESFFSSLASQNFSGGQGGETLEHRGAIKLHVGDDCTGFEKNTRHLAKLSQQGLPQWGIQKLILPITNAAGTQTPKGLMKFKRVKDSHHQRALTIDILEEARKIDGKNKDN